MKDGFQAFALEEEKEHCGIVFRDQLKNLHSISIVAVPFPVLHSCTSVPHAAVNPNHKIILLCYCTSVILLLL